MCLVTALENETGGTWGQEAHILHVYIYNFVLFLVVIIRLSPNSVSQLYCLKDDYKQKQRNTLPVTRITEIMHFNRLVMKNAFRAVHPILGQIYTCVMITCI